MDSGHAESASELWGSDRGSDGSTGGGESSLFLAFLDFVECCFRNRARAGRGTGAGRFAFNPDRPAGSPWESGSAETRDPSLPSEHSVLLTSLEFRRSLFP